MTCNRTCMLNPFSLDQTVSIETARQDRINLTLNLGDLEGSTRQIDRFRMALSPMPGDGFPEMMAYHGCIFIRPRQNGTRRFPQEIRKKKNEHKGIQAPPLFSGVLEYGQYYRPFMDDITKAHLRLQLSCNPTRFARHSPPRPDGNPPVNDPFAHKAGVAHDGEMATDFNDNWLPKGIHNDYYTPHHWRNNVSRYLRDIRDIIRQDIHTACGFSGTELVVANDPLFNFNSIETYWEYESENPVGLVHTFQKELKGFKSCGRDTEYEKNCLTLRYKIRKGVELCIYAKTNRRIRFEVRHNLQERLPEGLERKSSGSIIGAMRIITGCRHEAATVVNSAFQSMRDVGSIASSHVNETLLVIKIGRIVKDDVLAIMLVELLRIRGGIVPDNSAPPIRHAIERLQYHGMFEWNSRSKLYVLTGKYAHAARQLQSRIDSLMVPVGTPASLERRVHPRRTQPNIPPARKHPRRTSPFQIQVQVPPPPAVVYPRRTRPPLTQEQPILPPISTVKHPRRNSPNSLG